MEPIFACALAAAVAAAPATAAANAAAARRPEVSGFVDLVYAYGFNRPADAAHWFDGVGTAAKRDDEFSVNLAQIDVAMRPSPVGFHLAAGFGTALEVVHASEPAGSATSDGAWDHLVQASMQIRPGGPTGVLVEAGVFPSHVGFETLATRDNWNYTRSFMAEFSPYYQAGVKVAVPIGARWTSEVHLLNGWQIISDNNRGKTLGWKFARIGERLDVAFNGLLGPERPDDDHDLRLLLDTVLVWRIDAAWSLAGSLDWAGEERPDADAARWRGAAVYLRRAGEGGRCAGTLRIEQFDDPEGVISGTAQRLDGATATFEARPWPNLILKAEGRYDRSTAAVFASDEVDAAGDAVRDQRNQVILLVGAVASF